MTFYEISCLIIFSFEEPELPIYLIDSQLELQENTIFHGSNRDIEFHTLHV